MILAKGGKKKKMSKLNIEYIKTGELIPYVNNPRNNENAIDVVAGSIKEFGFKNPIIIDKDNVIIAGHTRLLASRKLGLEEVPVIRAEDLTEQQVKAFRIADNKTSEFAEWDYELLGLELKDIGNLFTGFSEEELGQFFEPDIEEIIEDNFDEELTQTPKSKIGNVYKLGNHRLMCGDSTKAEDIEKLMGGDKADLLVTDPPYNVNYTGGTKDQLTIQNDNLGDSEFRNFLSDAFKSTDKFMREGAAFYIWYGDSETINFREACKDAGWEVRQNLVWNKNSIIMGRQDYQWKHELCIYGWKDGAAHYFIDDRTQSTVFEDARPKYNSMKKAELIKLLDEIYSDKVSTTIINEPKPNVNDIHPTMKPIKLFARLVKNSSKANDKVLDVFGGSGTTLITCEQLDRKSYTMEFDPRYVDAIINRWEQFTGNKAELIEGEEND